MVSRDIVGPLLGGAFAAAGVSHADVAAACGGVPRERVTKWCNNNETAPLGALVMLADRLQDAAVEVIVAIAKRLGPAARQAIATRVLEAA